MLSFFPRGVLDEILNLIESVSEGFPSYSLIIPIFKKGDTNEVSNYRGITLLSTLGKLFTRILNNRLNSLAEE